MQKTAKNGALSYNPCTWSLTQEDCHQSKTMRLTVSSRSARACVRPCLKNRRKTTEMWTVENGSNNAYAMEKDTIAN